MSLTTSRLTKLLSTSYWLMACEQPLSTFAVLMYLIFFIVWHPEYLVMFCVIIPLLASFIVTCPWAQDQIQILFFRVPILAAFAHRDWTANLLGEPLAGNLLMSLTPTSVALEDRWDQHQGLLFPAGTYRFCRYPYLARCFLCLKILFLWTVYGGLTHSKVLEAKLQMYPMIPKVLTHRVPPRPAVETKSAVLSYIRTWWPWRTHINTVWGSVCLQVLREEMEVCSPTAGSMRRFPSGVGVSTDSPTADPAEEPADEFSSDPSEPEEDTAQVSGIWKRDLPMQMMTRYTPKVFDNRPWKIKDLGMLADLVPSSLTSGDLTEPVESAKFGTKRGLYNKEKPPKNGKRGIRGTFKDVASVGRVIIEYRRSLERLVNLFEWTHPLATLTLMCLVAAATIVSPLVSWPAVCLWSFVSYIRRIYQKSWWHATVIDITRFAVHSATIDPDERAKRVTYEACKRMVLGSEDFAKGPVRLQPNRGWLMNVIDHTINKDY
eukprot:Blabericola_migrator_1__3329@NODE_197_length_11501_cov_283_066206_g170_i0_p4_GENE_NODE_197_length_11501_cov_283_066206_g170_i0NODE_197_length_11501_cov_283_066206_g170_i0_p4_ORF_typecomplete_len491_score79_86PRT_C/PF08372_10/2e03PRT_C/PF08372_10/3_8e03PRT_C/PF08372_10/1_8e04PRT_C/PF08372_10/1_9e05PT/PF04886_12/0_48Pex24p/PF06398_11/2_4e02Pex24p/PF06398_11/0_18_NODE_197_length_11501_cov_283_066206_g170_i058897361